MVAPYNHFELADLRDRVLEELGETPISRSAALTLYARERLRAALNGRADLITEVRALAEMCGQAGYPDELWDFYELECDLDLPGADVATVTAAIHSFAATFVGQHAMPDSGQPEAE
jgi:hypothetical protein